MAAVPPPSPTGASTSQIHPDFAAALAAKFGGPMPPSPVNQPPMPLPLMKPPLGFGGRPPVSQPFGPFHPGPMMSAASMSAPNAGFSPEPGGIPNDGGGLGGFGMQPGPTHTPSIAVWGGGPDRSFGGVPGMGSAEFGRNYSPSFISPMGNPFYFDGPTGGFVDASGYPRAQSVDPNADPYGMSGGNFGSGMNYMGGGTMIPGPSHGMFSQAFQQAR